jgi:hypothetical protein
MAQMNAPRRRRRFTRPWRRLRRWWQHTPTEQAAVSLITAGFILLTAAGVIFYLSRHFNA